MNSAIEQEKLLIRRAKNGDTKAFSDLLKLHEHHLWKFALGITHGDEASAKDALQDSYIKAFRMLHTFKERARFTTWLWPIVRNQFFDNKKKWNREVPLNHSKLAEQQGSDLSLNADLEQKERKEAVIRAIHTLPAKEREIITLTYLMEMDYKEVAEIIGVKVGTVKSRLNRAKSKLEKKLRQNRELFK